MTGGGRASCVCLGVRVCFFVASHLRTTLFLNELKKHYYFCVDPSYISSSGGTGTLTGACLQSRILKLHQCCCRKMVVYLLLFSWYLFWSFICLPSSLPGCVLFALQQDTLS